MATLYATGKTFHMKELFKIKGFTWDQDDKEWTHQNLKKREIFEIITQCAGLGIKFRAISNKGRPLQLEVVFSKDRRSKRHDSDHEIKSMESINGSKFYYPGYSATNAPKPYGRKITVPSGDRNL